MDKCPFCGSKKIILETPYMDRVTGKKLTSYCCTAQKINKEYKEKHYHPIFGKK